MDTVSVLPTARFTKNAVTALTSPVWLPLSALRDSRHATRFFSSVSSISPFLARISLSQHPFFFPSYTDFICDPLTFCIHTCQPFSYWPIQLHLYSFILFINQQNIGNNNCFSPQGCPPTRFPKPQIFYFALLCSLDTTKDLFKVVMTQHTTNENHVQCQSQTSACPGVTVMPAGTALGEQHGDSSVT